MPFDGEILELPITQVIYRKDLYPRQNEHCRYTVQRYKLLTTKAPPIQVNQDFIGIDFRHRCLAGLERGETTIPAIIVPTRDDEHLLELAVAANLEHGLALSQEDKKWLAGMWYDLSAGNLTAQKTEIARRLRVHYDTINEWLKNRDHAHRQSVNDHIRKLSAQNLSQRKIAEEVGCSLGRVNARLCTESRKSELLNDLPPGFKPELYDVWNLTNNSTGIGHFGASDPRIIDNLIWRYARERDDVVVDLFAGGGTIIEVCRAWNRKWHAFDRKPRPARGDDIQRHDVSDGLPPLTCWDDVKLVFLDPPYSSRAAGKYSEDKTDLGNMPAEEFEQVLANLINELGTVLPAGAAIALLICNSQWSNPGHRIRRNDRHIEDLVTLPFEREIIAPLGKNGSTTVREWAEETRDCMVVSRKLLIWRV